MSLILILFTHIASYASILGLYFTVKPSQELTPWWHWFLLGTFAIISLFIVGREIFKYVKERHKSFRPGLPVNRYMCNLISQEGRSVIFSRDLSWGNEARAKAALLDKAKSGDLTIYLYKETETSKEL